MLKLDYAKQIEVFVGEMNMRFTNIYPQSILMYTNSFNDEELGLMDKVVWSYQEDPAQRYAFCFFQVKTGDLFKPAAWHSVDRKTTGKSVHNLEALIEFVFAEGRASWLLRSAFECRAPEAEIRRLRAVLDKRLSRLQ